MNCTSLPTLLRQLPVQVRKSGGPCRRSISTPSWHNSPMQNQWRNAMLSLSWSMQHRPHRRTGHGQLLVNGSSPLLSTICPAQHQPSHSLLPSNNRLMWPLRFLAQPLSATPLSMAQDRRSTAAHSMCMRRLRSFVADCHCSPLNGGVLECRKVARARHDPVQHLSAAASALRLSIKPD